MNEIDLTIESGKIVGLLGPNGSGKSTLIKLIAGLLTPSKGELTVLGNPVGVETKKIISYLPDKDYISDWMKIEEIVRMFEEFYEDFDSKRAFEMLNKLNLDKSAKLKQLSKGNKEKVQLILVMSRRAKLYLLDEPIGGVDPAARDYILNTIVLCASWLFCMKAYVAMSLGHLVQKHRLLGSIGFYIGIDLAENVIMGTLVAIFGSIFINPIQQFFSTMTTEEMIRTFHGIFLVIIIFYLVLGSIYFIVSKILLEKKLNLE